MQKKLIKHPESPGGRKDWENRSPRWRLNFTQAQLMILKEWAETHFNRNPDHLTHTDYLDLYQRISAAIESIEAPLTKTVDDFPLLEQEWDFDK